MTVRMTVGIRGMGLIGGSFEKAFAAAGHTVVNLKGACGELIGGCDLVVVCLPPRMVAPWIIRHSGDFSSGAVVVDAAGVKEGICRELEPVAANARWTFVGGHPMAGKERNGYANSDGALFRGASMIFTPYPHTAERTLERLKRIFSELGFSRFVVTDPRRHDRMIAYTSQLAHVVSSAYVRDELAREHIGFSAGSYQDMTRVATMDPETWSDLFLANREALSETIVRLKSRLDEFCEALDNCDSERLKRLIAQGREAKETRG